MASFLPRTDAALLAWATQFISAVQPDPVSYGIVAADVTAFVGLKDLYASSLAACAPGIRTRGTVAAKNQARADLKARAGFLSERIHGTPTVTDEQKFEAGLNVKAQPAPKPAPSVSPQVKVKNQGGRLLQVTINDAEVERRRKPPGCVGAVYFSFVGPTPPDSVAAWKWEGSSNKRIVQVLFNESVEPGTRVWVTAAWVNAKNEAGPACEPVGAYTQFGGMSAEA